MSRYCRIVAGLLLCLTVSLFSDSGPIEKFREGEFFYLSGDYYQAVDYYLSAVAANPNYGAALTGLVQCYIKLEEYEEALRMLEEARRVTGRDLSLSAMEARILIGLHRPDEAEQKINDFLNEEPQNSEALYSRALLEIYRDNLPSALASLNLILTAYPGDERSLLTSAVISDSLGRFAEANQFYRKLLTLPYQSAQVHYYLARHFFRQGEYREAASQADQGLSKSDGYLDLIVLKARIYLEQGEFERGAHFLEEALILKPDAQDLWYLLGATHESLNRFEQAYYAYSQVLDLQSDDEFARFALEDLLILFSDDRDPRRKLAAEYHFQLGAEYSDALLNHRAGWEFRRSVQLAPYFSDYRFEWSMSLLEQGFKDKFVSNLDFIKAIDPNHQNASDYFDIYSVEVANGLSSQWEYDPFLNDRELPVIYTAALDSQTDIRHHNGDTLVLHLLNDSLKSSDRLRIVSENNPVDNFSMAFSQARKVNADYFVLFSIKEQERLVSLSADIYLSSTGSHYGSVVQRRGGNNRLSSAVYYLTRDLISRFPVYGRLVSRDVDQGLVNLGSIDGILPDTELFVLREGSRLIHKVYDPFPWTSEDVVGRIIVSSSDDLLSQGRLVFEGSHDRINVNDYVFLLPDDQDIPDGPSSTSSLYSDILQIR